MKTELLASMAKASLILIYLALVVPFSDAGLVAYWPLDEGTGKEIIDATGNGYDGTFKGNPEWVEGVFGKALEFDGDDHVEVPDVANINPESITMATWVYFNEVTTTRQDYLSRADDYAFSLSEDSADKCIHAIITTGGDWLSAFGQTVVEPDRWYYTTLTYDANTKKLTVYLDGEEDGEISAPAGMEHRLGGSLTIGTYQNRYLSGRLDDIRIWDEALSVEQIKESMQPAPVEPTGKLSLTWGGIQNQS